MASVYQKGGIQDLVVLCVIRRSMQRAIKSKDHGSMVEWDYPRPALDVSGLDVDRTVFLGDLLIPFSGLETSASYLTGLL